MPAGLEIYNDYGTRQISQDSYPFNLVKSFYATISVRWSGIDPQYPNQFYTFNTGIQIGHDDFVFIHSESSAFVGRWHAGSINGDINSGNLILGSSAVVTVQVFICRFVYLSPIISGDYGLEIYDDQGRLTFSSFGYPVGALDAFTPWQRPQGSLPSGTKCAIANSTDAVYVSYSNPSTYFWGQAARLQGGTYFIAHSGIWDPYSQGYGQSGQQSPISQNSTQSPVVIIDVTNLPIPFG